MTTSSGDSHPQGAAVFGACEAQKPRPAAPTLQQFEASGNTTDVDVELQLLRELAGANSVHDVHHPDVPLADVPLSDVRLP